MPTNYRLKHGELNANYKHLPPTHVRLLPPTGGNGEWGLWSVHNTSSLPHLAAPAPRGSLPQDAVLPKLILLWPSHRPQLSQHSSNTALSHGNHPSGAAPAQPHRQQFPQPSCSTTSSSPWTAMCISAQICYTVRCKRTACSTMILYVGSRGSSALVVFLPPSCTWVSVGFFFSLFFIPYCQKKEF